MTLSRERNGTFFYICGANTNHKSGGKQCKGHRVRKEYVDDDVLRLIQTHMKTVLDTEKMIQEMNTASKNQTQYLLLDKEVGKLRRELSRISKRKSDLYEDYSERLITEEEYIQFLGSIPMKLRISRAVWTQYWRHRFGIPRITTLKKAGEM